jgi:hypothetical protein
LQQIDSRLNVGLSFAEYTDYVGDAQVEYDRTDWDDGELSCTLKVGIALEDALKQYFKAYSKWDQCMDDYACEVEGSVLAGIRKHWSEATERLQYADKKLDNARQFMSGPDSLSE